MKIDTYRLLFYIAISIPIARFIINYDFREWVGFIITFSALYIGLGVIFGNSKD